jgi:serine phosphatase RsbU (regulator of sigma subunit)
VHRQDFPAKDRKTVAGLRRFASDYAGGVKRRDLQRLFQRDATRALEILTRNEGIGPDRPDGNLSLLQRMKLLFLGLSFRLTPARRLLFAAALIFVPLGLTDVAVQVVPGRLTIDWSPFWFLLSISALLLLLALELVDRVRVRDELEVARQLQRDLLPAGQVLVPGLTVSHSYRTAHEVGGDFYDISAVGDRQAALIIGDASGHGMAAGLLMATAKATLGLAIDLDPEPGKAVTALNRRLCATGNRRSFLALFYGLLDLATGDLDYVCAGHPFPLLRRGDGSVEEIGTGSLPLGLRPHLDLPVNRVRLLPGDLLLLYTDGLPEAVREGTGTAFGFPRVRSLVAEDPLSRGPEPEGLVARLLAELEEHLAGEAHQDDVSVVAIRFEGGDGT